MKSYVGSPITMAPEILSNKTYDERCDIWSIGIIMYKMLTGDYPFIPPKFGGVNDLLEMI
jgi:serine/threonine protein kinase